jgi:hypothetical protein
LARVVESKRRKTNGRKTRAGYTHTQKEFLAEVAGINKYFAEAEFIFL